MRKGLSSRFFLEAMNGVDDKYVMEAVTYKSAGLRKIKRVLAAAAVFVLCLAGSIQVALRFDHFRAGCSAYAGDIVNGVYYYHVVHEGVYAYSPGRKPQKQLSTFWYESYQVNDYGIYYKMGRRLYVQEHATGERRRLYKANAFQYTHIGFCLQQDGNVIVTLYNKHNEMVCEVLLDGRTGEVLETVMEPVSYQEADYTYYSDTHFQVGGRRIVLQESEDRKFIVTENGQPLSADDTTLFTVTKWSANYVGDYLWFQIREDQEDETDGIMSALVLTPDGTVEKKELCPMYVSMFSGNNEYLFWDLSSSDIVWCYDVDTEEGWQLTMDTDMTIYEIVTDGNYLYSCVPWDDYQALWEIVTDEAGKPIAIRLLDDDIRK